MAVQEKQSQPKKLRKITSIFNQLLEYIPKDHALYTFIETHINRIESYKNEQQFADAYSVAAAVNPKLFYSRPPELMFPELVNQLFEIEQSSLNEVCLKAQQTFVDETAVEFVTWGCAVKAIILNEPIPNGIMKQNQVITEPKV